MTSATGSKREYPHRERVDDTSGDNVIIPATFYKLRDYRRPRDKYDLMAAGIEKRTRVPQVGVKGKTR
jgi:hypothetical protein